MGRPNLSSLRLAIAGIALTLAAGCSAGSGWSGFDVSTNDQPIITGNENIVRPACGAKFECTFKRPDGKTDDDDLRFDCNTFRSDGAIVVSGVTAGSWSYDGSTLTVEATVNGARTTGTCRPD
jgi:hypothetical protein